MISKHLYLDASIVNFRLIKFCIEVASYFFGCLEPPLGDGQEVVDILAIL